MYNISKVLDCISCEKCKVFGKMQTLGIATALRIAFKGKKYMKQIKRIEISAFINTFAKISSSVYVVKRMADRNYD